MTRVLVSGAGGFVGLPVLARLASSGCEVHAVSMRARPLALAGVSWHRLDLDDRDAIEALMAELAPERLVHLAWYTEHGQFWRAPENLVWVERSLRLIRAFTRHGGLRLVVTGTCAEYDWWTATGPLAESSSPLVPATLYGVAKDSLRRLVSAYAEQEGVELAWARLFLLYGPREAPGRLVPSVTRALLRGEPVAIGSPEQVRDFLHVEDVAGAVVALLESSVVGAVNIASGVGVTVGEVVERLVELIGRPDPVRSRALRERLGEPPLLLADVARLREEVGYRPRLSLTDGLAATVRWWREHGE